ncbi:tight adherence protein B [Paramicrobacterium humi]|uniref:Tight adherence protein B n=1 Tax=Paramicrobacterium humi TaxID=640635 RepID=A0A1H4TCG5_9MICO|nr:type II secretion system F family protein [Microbacterium humi]SEC54203.1 tight adherence protein B [Microbacterium humi]
MTWLVGGALGAGLVLIMIAVAFPDTSLAPHGFRPGRLQTAIRTRLTLAGFGPVPVPVFIGVSVVLALLAGGAAHVGWGVIALTVAAAGAGALLPSLVVGWRARARRRAHRMLWPDVVDHLIASIRSGASLPDAVAALATAGPEPLRPAFAEYARDYRATASFSGSVERLKGALGDPVADRILETLRMARDVGGTELPSVLRSLAASLRDETALRAEVDARQSWVRNAAKLGVAAPWLILVLLATRPEAAIAYNSAVGTTVIIVGAAVSVVAYRIMLSLGRLPEERRWFK